MRLLRSVFFWLHLAAGLLCGVVIAIMAFTGAVLAFEHEIVEWAERDVRRVEAPAAGASSLSPVDLDSSDESALHPPTSSNAATPTTADSAAVRPVRAALISPPGPVPIRIVPSDVRRPCPGSGRLRPGRHDSAVEV